MRQHYSVLYNQFIDKIVVELTERYRTESIDSDLALYKEMVGIFKTGVIAN